MLALTPRSTAACRGASRAPGAAPISARPRAVAARVATPTRAQQAAAAQHDEVALDDDISTKDLAALLTTLTAPDMAIAELQLKMGGLQLKVRRSVDAEPAAPVAAAPAAFAGVVVPEAMLQPEPQLAPAYQSMDDYPPSAQDSMDDEALLFVTATKVGVFRRKGKAAVGDQVRKNQVLGSIEQLGTLVDVKAPQDGELVKLAADGEPVEYGGAVATLAPAFAIAETGKTSVRF